MKEVGCGMFLVIAFVTLTVTASLGYWLVYPWIVHQQTFAMRQSYGYVQSQQTKLQTLATDYRRAQSTMDALPADDSRVANLQAQEQADVDQMKAQAALMSPADIPASVRGIMDGGGQ